jgi:type II restriction enzyme
MSDLNKAKKQLDIVIKKARIHLYKPIQIAEILRVHRLKQDFSLLNLETYRNQSKRWRDKVSQRLVGRICTSSARFQDNLFEENAMPPRLLSALGDENEKEDGKGMVEAYIYESIKSKFGTLEKLGDYLENSTPDSFRLSEFISGFVSDPGLKRSIDKAYEITVFALFDSLVRHLKIEVSIRMPEERKALLKDFEDFTKILLGIDSEKSEITAPARLYRVGVANAADRGLDMWANFGPAIQVKHLSLSEDLAKDIVGGVSADRIVIVCKSAEKTLIDRVLNQLGFSHRIQGIITQDDLERWYGKCFLDRYKENLGTTLLKNLVKEFYEEFPSAGEALSQFIREREYDKIRFKGIFGRDKAQKQMELK